MRFTPTFLIITGRKHDCPLKLKGYQGFLVSEAVGERSHA
jgi:hypothetical protein